MSVIVKSERGEKERKRKREVVTFRQGKNISLYYANTGRTINKLDVFRGSGHRLPFSECNMNI